MKVINKYQQRKPIGGHHYPEMGLTLRGETMDEVAKKLKDLRITNGRPVGNPEKDILDFYAEHFPYMLVEDETVQLPKEMTEDYIRYRHWIFASWRNPPKRLVTHREAKERQKICKNCPQMKQVSWGSSDEAKELERRSFMLTCGVKKDEDFGYCSCHRWDNNVATFFHAAEAFTAKGKDAEVPKTCWVGVL